jgi:archaeal preflagellin peptidase FlaK
MDIFRVILALLLLAYASYSDIKKRSVSNSVWLVLAVLGIVFGIYGIAVQGISFFVPLVFSFVITGVFAYIFFRLGLFGAADAKAFICIALLFPVRPEFFVFSSTFPLFGASLPIVFPFALIVLLNAAVLALAVPIYLFFRNLNNLGVNEFMRNASMCFVAYRVKVGELCNIKFARLTHKYEAIEGRLTRRYSLGGIALDNDTIQQLKAYHEEGKIAAEVWITPELPYILFVTLGFLLCCLLGF